MSKVDIEKYKECPKNQPRSVSKKRTLKKHTIFFIPRVAIILLCLAIPKTWSVSNYSPEACSALIWPLSGIEDVEPVQIRGPSPPETAEVERRHEKIRNETELVTGIVAQNVDSKIVVFGLAMNSEVRVWS